MKNLFKVLLGGILLLTTFSNSLKAQDNTGTEFWFTVFAETFIDHLPGVYVVGNYDAVVTLDYVARDPANDLANDPQCTRYTFNLVGGQPQYVDIPYDLQALCWRYADDYDSVETIQKNGIRITSTTPIAVYSQFYTVNSSELTALMPANMMGTDYIVSAYREITNETNDFNARTTIVGMEDNTLISITLPTSTWTSVIIQDINGLDSNAISRLPGTTWSVTLNRGETYTFISNDNDDTLEHINPGSTVTVNNNQGLNGVRISANKHISVLGGADCTWVGNDEYPGCGACDLTTTHLKPVTEWGSKFVTTQTLARPNQASLLVGLNANNPNIEPYPQNYNELSVADYLLVTAKDNGTTINFAGTNPYTKTLNAGEWFIYESPGNSNPTTPPPGTDPGAAHKVITSNNPIQIVQMMKGYQCDNVGAADPTQMLVIEESKWDDNYIVTNPTQYTNNFFVFLINEPNGNNDARNTLNLFAGGTAVPIPNGVSATNDGNNGWTQIGTTGYWFQRLNVGAGIAIKARSIPTSPGAPTYPFGFYASGSQGAASYGYMGGAVCQLEVFTSAIPDTVCEGSPLVLSLDSTVNGGTVNGTISYDFTWDVYDGTGTNVYTFSGTNDSADHEFAAIGNGNMYALLEVTDNAGCYARDTAYFYVNPLPSFDPGTDIVACNSTVLPTISGTQLSGNQAYYTNTDGTGTSYLPGATVTSSGTYYMFDSTGVACSDEESFLITINTSPVVDPSSISASCDAAELNYELSFTVTGGNGGPYTVTEIAPGGIGGSFTGNVYTTNPIPTGTVYNFEVSDANACTPTPVQGVFNCNCASDAGTMNTTPISLCGNGLISAPTGSVAPVLDTDDIEKFVLHTNSGGTLGTILTENNSPDFSFDPGSMNYGTTYYISRVVGNDAGSGLVDLNDACLSVAIGTPATWNDEVVVNMTSGGDVCEGSTSSLELVISGGGPYNLVYSDGTSNQNIINANDNHSESVSPLSNTTYTLVSAVSNTTGCSADFSSGAPSVTINVFDSPVSNNLMESCDASAQFYTVSFDITQGQSPYTVVVNSPAGINGSFNGNTWTSDPIPSGTVYDISLSDGNNCSVETITGSNSCPCLTDAGGMNTSLQEICGPGQITVSQDLTQPVFLDGNDALNFVLHTLSGTTLGTVLSQSTNPSFSFDPGTMNYGTTYYISAVVGNDNGSGMVDLGDQCLDVSEGVPVVWKEQPIAVIGSNAPICSGETLMLNGNTQSQMNGVSYSWTGNGGYMSSAQNPSIADIQSNMSGDLILTVSKDGCFDDDTLNLVVNQTAIANFSAQLMTPKSEPHRYQFTNLSTGIGTYSWSFGDGEFSTDVDPEHQYLLTDGEADVTLIAYGIEGCNDTTTLSVDLLMIPIPDTVLVYMPNSFTPDGNEYNQYFGPVFNESVDLTSYQLSIYNRWGQKIFETNDLEVGWDGSFESQLVQSGIYTWVVSFTDKFTFKSYKYEGHLNLLK